MKYFLVVGERSGDLHTSKLIREIRVKDPASEFRFWGGDLMSHEANGLSVHYKEMAFMGFWEVIKNYYLLKKLFNKCLEEIIEYKPNALILVDFSGFNMRLAKRLEDSKIPIFYYIAPKVWAWNQSRAYKIKKYINKLFTILPFEDEFFKSYEIDSEYVGNPLVERIDEYLKINNQVAKDLKQIAVLPGSRKQEVSTMLSIMLEVVSYFKDYRFVVAGVDNLSSELYKPVEDLENVEVHFGDTYEILQKSEAAIVTSGTATLETALFNTPQIVCYKTSPISYAIGRAVIKIKFISLVNLIADQAIVKELVQFDLTKENITLELNKILQDSRYRKEMLRGYELIQNRLGKQSASKNVAEAIFKSIS